MLVDFRRFPGIRRLTADYVHDFPAVSEFFSGNPWERSDWSRAIERAQARRCNTNELASVVADQQRRRGAPPAAIHAGRRLAETATIAVVTGQQAGLFGGPLYTFLKAITALKLAGEITRNHRVPAVAVFWIEAEDHDWDEVRGCTVVNEQGAPVHLELPARAGDDSARVADVRFDASIAAVIDQLDRTLPATEFHAPLVAALRNIYKEGAGTADAFGRFMEHALGSAGLVVYDASDVAAKPLARDVFVHELSHAGETARRASDVGSQLTARGYHAQVQAGDGSVSLFYLDGSSRRPLRRDGDRFLVANRSVDQASLVDEARQHPERFSPNVLLRPIVQDTIFPTVAYVAGPNELAYLAQLSHVHAHFGLSMPLLYPRASATLVDAAAWRFLSKYNLPFESLQRQDEAALNELLAAQMPETVERAFDAAVRTTDAAMARLVEVMPALDPTLEGAARSTLTKMQHDLETLHGKMIHTAKRRDETLRRQFARTQALAFPGGQPQERVIGGVSFLNQYGPALVDRLLEILPMEPGHWVLTV
jgi:bacillithiol biosynthesis cysteine-adding enzyme BshC